MSEYQIYEFQSVDRPLTSEERQQVCQLSSRVNPTSHRAMFTYSYGDFRGDPLDTLAKYFDGMYYIANFGVQQLAFRFPNALLDKAAIAHLQNRDFNHLDIANLIEEIEGLGKSQKNAFKDQIRALMEHIIKRRYVDLPREYNGWERTIRNIRPEIEDLLETSPSLANDYPQLVDRVYQQCLKKLRPEYQNVDFPDTWQLTRSLDDLLNLDLWQ